MNSLISHYNLTAPTITNWFIQTTATYFEIEDTNAEISLDVTKGSGTGKFKNQDALNIRVFNYDKFITSIPNEPFKHCRKRCDFLLDSRNHRYLILGEIKDRRILDENARENVRMIAKNQLLSSLKTLLEVPEIDSHSTHKDIKRCCYFNKQSSSPATLTATTAFNRLPNFYTDGFQMSNPEIEAYGFDFYEYTGEQTMTLMN